MPTSCSRSVGPVTNWKLRTQPIWSAASPPSIWLVFIRGCQFGRPLKSRMRAQTASTGASMTLETVTVAMRPRPPRNLLPGRIVRSADCAYQSVCAAINRSENATARSRSRRQGVLERLATGAWGLREVKTSTGPKDYHFDDIALQLYVLKGTSVAISSVELVHVNKKYVRVLGGVRIMTHI